MVISQQIRFPVKVQHHRPMLRPVEHGRCNGGVPEDLAPGTNGRIGRDDNAGFQIPLVDDLEQGRRRFLGSARYPSSSMINSAGPGK